MNNEVPENNEVSENKIEPAKVTKSKADETLDLIVQIRSLLGCTTGEALDVYKQLNFENSVVTK